MTKGLSNRFSLRSHCIVAFVFLSALPMTAEAKAKENTSGICVLTPIEPVRVLIKGAAMQILTATMTPQTPAEALGVQSSEAKRLKDTYEVGCSSFKPESSYILRDGTSPRITLGMLVKKVDSSNQRIMIQFNSVPPDLEDGTHYWDIELPKAGPTTKKIGIVQMDTASFATPSRLGISYNDPVLDALHSGEAAQGKSGQHDVAVVNLLWKNREFFGGEGTSRGGEGPFRTKETQSERERGAVSNIVELFVAKSLPLRSDWSPPPSGPLRLASTPKQTPTPTRGQVRWRIAESTWAQKVWFDGCSKEYKDEDREKDSPNGSGSDDSQTPCYLRSLDHLSFSVRERNTLPLIVTLELQAYSPAQQEGTKGTAQKSTAVGAWSVVLSYPLQIASEARVESLPLPISRITRIVCGIEVREKEDKKDEILRRDRWRTLTETLRRLDEIGNKLKNSNWTLEDYLFLWNEIRTATHIETKKDLADKVNSITEIDRTRLADIKATIDELLKFLSFLEDFRDDLKPLSNSLRKDTENFLSDIVQLIEKPTWEKDDVERLQLYIAGISPLVNRFTTLSTYNRQLEETAVVGNTASASVLDHQLYAGQCFARVCYSGWSPSFIARGTPQARCEDGSDVAYDGTTKLTVRDRSILSGPQTLVVRVRRDGTGDDAVQRWTLNPPDKVAMESGPAYEDFQIPVPAKASEGEGPYRVDIRIDAIAPEALYREGSRDTLRVEQQLASLPDRQFYAYLRPRGPFGFPGSPRSIRMFATIPTQVVGIRLPANIRNLESSSDSTLYELTILRAGLAVGLEPWNYDLGKNLSPVPVRFLAGFNFFTISRSSAGVDPTFFVSARVTFPLLERDNKVASQVGTSVSFGPSLEVDLRTGQPYFLLNLGLDILTLFAAK